jgi:hypothetical protein
VSEEVAAKALVRQRNLIGFLRLVPTQRKCDKTHVLQVLSCAKGESLELPSERSHIENAKLFEMLTNSTVGSGWLQQVSLARCAPQDLGVAWRYANKWHSEDTIWLSLIRGRNTEPDLYGGSLFDRANVKTSPSSDSGIRHQSPRHRTLLHFPFQRMRQFLDLRRQLGALVSELPSHVCSSELLRVLVRRVVLLACMIRPSNPRASNVQEHADRCVNYAGIH